MSKTGDPTPLLMESASEDSQQTTQNKKNEEGAWRRCWGLEVVSVSLSQVTSELSTEVRMATGGRNGRSWSPQKQ